MSTSTCVDVLCRENDQDVDWEQVTRRGDPAEVVVAYAKRISADTIVIGTQGRTGRANLIAGSVARKVMAGATAPS